ncbi:MAG: lysostaphin resistance A-like protein [bacterium]
MNQLNGNVEEAHPSLRVIFGLIFSGIILAIFVTLTAKIVYPSIQLVLGEVFIIVPAVAYIVLKKYHFRNVFRLYKIEKNVVVVSAILAISLTILSDEIDRIISTFVKLSPEFEELISRMLKADTFTEWVVLFASAVILAGVIEEMLFRGLLLKALEKRVEVTSAIFFSALIFAFAHPVPWFIQVLILGFILGYMTWRSNSIFPSIILHSVNNAFALIFNNVDPAKVSWYTWNGHVYPPIVAIAACITFYGFKWFIRTTEKGEEVHEYGKTNT